MDNKRLLLVKLLLIFVICSVFGQKFVTESNSNEIIAYGLHHKHLHAGRDMKDPQNIHIVSLDKSYLQNSFNLDLVYSDNLFFSTSDKAEEYEALAAVNGGFFDVKNAGSISFIEYDGQSVAIRSKRVETSPSKKQNIDGALIFTKMGDLIIERARPDSFYLEAYEEKWVLVAGPLLIEKGVKTDLLDNDFVSKRHPRTVVAKTKSDILFITIDGRHEEASGMNLLELQDYLVSLKTIDAINLDGGGSTTMYVDGKMSYGVVNCPSDNKKFDHLGERKVANAILILKK